MCLASLRLVIFHEPFCKFTRKYHSSWSLEFAPRPERVERVVASPKRIPQSLEMKSFLYAAIVILQVTTSFCEMRKTIKVLKFPQIGKFGGFSKPVGHYDFEPGDQKEATICMKFRTFAYNEGFGCPFFMVTHPDLFAEAKDKFIWLYCVGWKTGMEEDDNKQVGTTELFISHDNQTDKTQSLQQAEKTRWHFNLYLYFIVINKYFSYFPIVCKETHFAGVSCCSKAG